MITNNKLTQIIVLIHWITIFGHIALKIKHLFYYYYYFFQWELLLKALFIFIPGGGVSVEIPTLLMLAVSITDVLFGI